jgi:hypothetical protein
MRDVFPTNSDRGHPQQRDARPFSGESLLGLERNWLIVCLVWALKADQVVYARRAFYSTVVAKAHSRNPATAAPSAIFPRSPSFPKLRLRHSAKQTALETIAHDGMKIFFVKYDLGHREKAVLESVPNSPVKEILHQRSSRLGRCPDNSDLLLSIHQFHIS